ncbi:MAG: bifunctional methionine sulfoxide reductase B/A protein [Sulfurospirillum sp.]|nr:bifunctional methionine sulfoxide reductase B/A protein [Sulfurospirillum sp.]MBL0703839.1 bifunctional methionine sulfoxide reductase B/A protein [Sulfurospirillum sp.]
MILFTSINLNAKEQKILNLNQLTDKESRVIVDKGTQKAFSGIYDKHTQDGTYLCKWCDGELYKSSSKFDSGCGWPSFDDEIQGAVKQVKDADGKRVEIVCSNCGGHLGHIFKGEGFTPKNTRHCVNSISLKFQKKDTHSLSKAYFAGGCFWGVEYHFENLKNVTDVISGFMGGNIKNPSYKEVISGQSGHLEVVEISYNPKKVTYESLAKLFFEIHDPTQMNGQGPDIGSQYLSAVFVSNENERKTIEKLIGILNSKGMKIATKIENKKTFYPAEEYHQDYYKRKGSQPYCHTYIKRF